jgi:hypothetical protein
LIIVPVVLVIEVGVVVEICEAGSVLLIIILLILLLFYILVLLIVAVLYVI